MQSHLPQAYLEGLVCAVKAQAQLHPHSPKCSVVLEATNGWQLSLFFFPFEASRRRVISQSGAFQGCMVFVPAVQVPHSSARWWVASETGCQSCPAIGAVSEDQVSCFGAVVMVTAALAKQWLEEEEGCNCSWQILGRCVTWSGLACLVTLNCTKRLSWTIMLKSRGWESGTDFEFSKT